MEMIDEFIEQAYEGMAIVDADGYITKFNYEKLLGIKEDEVLGKHVTDVLENTRLDVVLKTGKSEIGDIQVIGGKQVIASRIPIERDGKIIGAVGTILFKDLAEVKYMADYIDNMKRQMRDYKQELKRLNQAKYSFDNIITDNSRMLGLIESARKAAETHSTVCISGESGTGKEYFAHSIHKASPRHYGPFVRINCAAIPKDLLESELFGYAPGAFTGASSAGKIGKFELASGGTIFLDEISAMPLEMQSKLLRVLEEREFEKIGSNVKIDVDVRIISATNEDLRMLVSKDKFREDLYYRLEVVGIKIPPLRERKDDIYLLAENFLNSLKASYAEKKQFSKSALNVLISHEWPGNVRELRNVVESSMSMAEGNTIEIADLPEYLRIMAGEDQATSGEATDLITASLEMSFSCDSLNLKHCVESVERQAILEAMRKNKHSKTDAAKMLGIHRTQLYKKMKKLGLEVEEE
ncbi:MAG: sigma 54-interacting transcriptional regulator [Clostridia bacterium]|nr:sigma 54-interacting transcriptional regulator [Clostridia bacterium]